MKNLDEIVKECTLDIMSLGIEIGDIAEVIVNSRAVSRWGRCKKRAGKYYIEISSKLLEDSIEDMATKNTVAHELLHTIKGGMKHTGEWKAAAAMMNTFYGYNIKRCTSSEEKGIEVSVEDTMARFKYDVRCTKCGKHNYYCKETKVIKSIKYEPTNYRCGVCGSHLEVITL